jgi:hypothetical protein
MPYGKDKDLLICPEPVVVIYIEKPMKTVTDGNLDAMAERLVDAAHGW